jgi:predicted nucleic acid-binding protein
MGLLFFDTSALVKRYYEEPGTDRVDELIEGEDTVVISSLSIIETVSAFRRKYNRGHLAEEHMNDLLSAFFQEALDDFVIVPMEDSVVGFSFDLVLEDDLRTLDSLQLSAALAVAESEDDVAFVSAATELTEIAARWELNAINPVN